MKQGLWLLNRLAATIIGCIVVGALAAIVVSLVDAVTCGPTCVTILGSDKGSHCAAYASTCGRFIGEFLTSLVFGIPCALVLGVLPGAVALTLTPAKQRPWQSLPFLIAGTLLGVGACLVLANRFGVEYPAMSILLFAIPSTTGLATAAYIDRVRAALHLNGAIA